MIEKKEVITMANSLGLSPDTIEKDYVLGWLLWGIQQSDFSETWLFKGGTCLKKCYFETFRISEDLDYTIRQSEHLSADFLREAFNSITDKIYDETGIDFFKDQFKFKVLPKENGQASAQGVIHYNGPLRRKQGATPSVASIKLDLTTDEIIVLPPQKQRVQHSYSDEPEIGIWSTCYAFEELIAEKTRALAERARPRDLYDVIHFFRNRGMIKNTQLILDVLKKKCDYKEIDVPTYAAINNHAKMDELYAQWRNMLSHQLPALPAPESFLVDLESFFQWIAGDLKEKRFFAQTAMDGEIFQPIRTTQAVSTDAVTYKIQFSAANRMCIEIEYNGKPRLVEPLSFRITNSGKKLFYGYERETTQLKSFDIEKIQRATIINISYTEKEYAVEINAVER